MVMDTYFCVQLVLRLTEKYGIIIPSVNQCVEVVWFLK